MPQAPPFQTLRFISFVSMAWMLAAAHSALAFTWPTPAAVIEYYNVGIDHYFLTDDTQEQSAIEAGKAGPGWVRTGQSFTAYLTSTCSGTCFPVARFYAPSVNTHFFTLDAAEAEILRRPDSGWFSEGIAFYADPPSATGTCGTFETPIHRLYNNRAGVHDVNHRYVTSTAERDRMIAKGWAYEGVRFCVLEANDSPIKSFRVDQWRLDNGGVQPSSVCEDEAQNLGACVAVNNLPAPTTHHSIGSPQVFGDKTGMVSYNVFTEGSLTDAAAATTVFVQQSPDFETLGVHVDTIQRGAALYTSVNPLYQFKTTVDAGAQDKRVFPFMRAYETDAQISVKFIANVRTVSVRNSASQAIGHPTLELIDQRSGHHLYFTTLVFGTIPISGPDYLAPDAGTGKVIVGTTFRDNSPYIRNFGSWTFSTPSGFVPENPWGRGGAFEYRMDRTEFARVLASARTVDPALSAAPEDYLLDNFHFNNEVYGDGEIGMNLGGFRLEIVRR